MSNPHSKGPIRQRKLTDCFCLIIFLAFWVFIGYISIYAYSKGNYSNIAKPIDADKNICGEGDFKDYSILYINEPTSVQFYKTSVCVKACPTSSEAKIDCKPNSHIKDCFDLTPVSSFTLFHRLCIPTAKEMSSLVKNNIHLGYFNEALEDIKEVWPMLIVGFILSIVIIAIYLFLIRLCSKVFVYLLVFLVLIGLIALGGFCWQKHQLLLNENADVYKMRANGDMKDVNDPHVSITEKEASVYGNEQSSKWKTAAIILWVVAGIYFLMILLLFSRINLAANILESTAEFVQDEPSVFVIPLIFTIALLVFLAYWLPTISMLSSVGEVSTENRTIFINIKWESSTRAFIWVMIFALLWGISFNFSQETFSIAAMSSSWYFERSDKSNVSSLTVICWSFTYHIGTLAFGSFLIAVLWLIQVILSYLYSKLKEIGAEDTAAGFLVKCAGCFVACFERTLKFINKHAYIETALRNLDFCPAAAKCLEITTKNFLRFGVLLGLTEMFLFMGSLLITCATTFLMNYVIEAYANRYNIEVDTIGPLLFVFLFTLTVCIIFSYVYEVSADSLLHCYILDEEDGHIDRNVGHGAPEKLMSTIKIHHESQIKLNS
jgi:hypothetical protein